MLVTTEVPLTCHYSSLSSFGDSGSRRPKRHVLKRDTAATNVGTVTGNPWDARYKGRGTFLSDDGSVTTGLLPQEPHVLQVVTRHQGALELDLQYVLSTGLVAVTVRRKNNFLELLALDLYGDLLIYNIPQDYNLTEHYKVVSMPANVNNTTLSCACFLSETVILVGISPYLFTWDYETQQMVHWSSDEDCLYDYNINNQKWTNIWNKAAGMWMGRPSCKTKVYQTLHDNAKNILPNNNGLIPVAALSVVYDDEKQPCGVLALYANGTLKLWTCPCPDTRRILLAEDDDDPFGMSPTTKQIIINPWMYPELCREISTTKNNSKNSTKTVIPLPNTWSPECDSVSMLSTYHKTSHDDSVSTNNINRGNFTLVLGIRTAWSWFDEEGEEESNDNNNYHLVWVQGSIPSTAANATMINKDKACRCLTSQSEHHRRVGWAFSSSSKNSDNKTQIPNILNILWWNTTTTTTTTTTNKSMLLLESFLFSTQQEDMIVIQPHITASTQEDYHHFPTFIPDFIHEDLPNLSVEEQLEAIHAFYMKQLFVPIGGSPPPPICVTRALSSLHYSSNRGDSNNVEYKTLMAMRAVSLSSTTYQSRTGQSMTPPTTTPASCKEKKTSSIYYRFRANNNNNNAIMDRNTTPTPKDDDSHHQEDESTKVMIQRWKLLIKKSRELEKEFYQMPLGLMVINNHSLCLVRTGSWNVLIVHHNSPTPTSPTSPSTSITNNTTLSQIQCQLDQLAVTLYQHANKSSLIEMQELEHSVNLMIPQMMGGCFVAGLEKNQHVILKLSCMNLGFQASKQILSDTTFRQTLLPLWKSLNTSDNHQDCWTWLHQYSTSTTTTPTGLFQLVHNNKSTSIEIVNSQSSGDATMVGIVQAAASVTRHNLQHIRKMALARALLLGALHQHSYDNNYYDGDEVNPQPLDAAWRSYLHVSTIQWVNSQYCCITNNNTKQSSSSSAPRRNVPPPRAFTPLKSKNKNHSSSSSLTPHHANNQSDENSTLQQDKQDRSRPKYSDQPRNLTDSNITKKGTILEVRLHEIAKVMVERNYNSDPNSVLKLTYAYLQLAFFSSSDSTELPELAILPHSFNNRKRYALRLLAPFIAYPIQGQLKMKTTFARNEMTAECLLAEAKFAFLSSFKENRNPTEQQQPSHVKRLCSGASTLLLENTPSLQYNSCTATNLEEALKALRQVPDGWSVHRLTPSSSDFYDSFIIEFIRNLLQDDDGNHDGIILEKEFVLENEHLQLLANMQTVKLLLLPWVVTAKNAHVDPLSLIINNSNINDNNHADDSFNNTNASTTNNNSLKKSICQLIWILLKICVLIHRVTLLERHSVTSTGATNFSITTKNHISEIILSAVKEAINAIEQNLPCTMYQESMVEYAILWSSSFRHANMAQEWNHAFNACLSNPIKSRRINNFRRLVISMVDTGHLKQLLDLFPISVVKNDSSSSILLEASEGTNDDNISDSMDVEDDVDGNVRTSSTNKNTTGDVDFYELAVETLVEASLEQSRSGGISYFHSRQPKTNYRGCLYALHAASGNWRRATQAMDLYGILGMANVSDGKEGGDEDTTSPKNMTASQKQVMSEISLSSLSSAHAIRLVKNPNHRFIVSGEVGPYPVPPCFRDSSTLNPNGNDEPSDIQRKRNRCSDMIFASPTVLNGSDGYNSNRLNHLLTEKSLMNRAVKMMVLKTLHLDPKSPDSILTLIKSSDLEAIDMSARLGYYQHGLTLAYCRRLQQQRARRGGRDFVADALGYILSKYLSVVAIKSTRPQPHNMHSFEDSVMGGEDIENTKNLSRPTTLQLGHMLMSSNLSPSTLIGESWRSLDLCQNTTKGLAALTLLQHFTTKYSNAGNFLAIEVAGRLLDLDEGRAELPLWLQDLLLGNDENNTVGLFAINKMKSSETSPSFADPGALARLYMKKGLYVSACNVITSTLLGPNNSRKKAASSRLPEKGNIDYVPYNTIDLLWNLIEEQVKGVTIDDDHKNEMLRARKKMQHALETHFELMQLSEKGMHSARVLDSS